jgi:ABC-2 type transport system permease protein
MHLIALATATMRRELTHRLATLSGLLTNIFFGLLRIAVLTALFNDYAAARDIAVEAAKVNGLSLSQAVAFSGITQAIIMYLSLFARADHPVALCGLF